jgi:hypothetical protein
MRRWVVGLGLLLVASPTFAANILIYDSLDPSFCGGAQPAREAATRCGHTFTAYGAGSEAQWISDLSTGTWDIVVFDVASTYASAANTQVLTPMLTSQLDAMNSWLLGHPTGCGVIALWFMGEEQAHPIFNYMGVDFAYNFARPAPIHSWAAADPVWAGLPDPLQGQEFCYGIDGAAVTVLPGAEALGGFTAGPAVGEAGLVANHNRHTWYIGVTGIGGTADDDGDTLRDWSELYCNIFEHCLANPTGTRTGTWGSLKTLYR